MSSEQPDRLAAVRGLRRVLHKQQTLDQIEANAANALAPLTRELLYGTVRHYYSLGAQVNERLDKPLARKQPELWALLLIGAYQLAHTRVPDHAAINTSVALTKDLGKPWARGLVNAVLRSIQRSSQHSQPITQLGANPQDQPNHSEHPPWLETQLRAQHSDQADALLAANNQRAPMALRINTGRTTRAEVEAQLQRAAIEYQTGHSRDSLVLTTPQTSASLPGFAAGALAVQDVGAQLAADCWPEGGGAPLRVLDACAAPGGKLHHLRARRPQDHYVALESNQSRLEQLKTEALRLGHTPEHYQLADATSTQWWDGQPFDRILLDAPCSGTGTLRRHPDIKLHVQEDELAGHADKQLKLLATLWATLRPGGSLLYCTCSLLQQENDAVVARFIESQEQVQVQVLRLPTGHATQYGWQLTPLDPTTDGFYYARLDYTPGKNSSA